ncbi:hypothetical protein MMC19_004041 [Ptychographa xylographoides]|nr:hypothetical protein [Ptychographa xylographoides]
MFAVAFKRSREEDEGELDVMRTERKKPRTLPFRTSPTTKHTSFFSQSRQVPRAPVLTPAESSEDDSDDASTGRIRRMVPSRLTASSIVHVDDDDSDLDMEDSQPLGSPLWSPRLPTSPASSPQHFTAPSPLPLKAVKQVQQLSISNTRIPTPIYGHFNISPQDTPMTIGGLPSATTPEPPSTKYATFYETQHDLFLRRRRLPSPISEDENMDSPTTTTSGMLRKLDMGMGTPTSTTHPLQDVIMITPVTPDQFLGSEWRDKRRGGMDGRMKETEHLQPVTEGKVVISMGFRADCEKCTGRVPGHYSHVLRV